jgi:uncharacterized protein (TIGR00369 family)
MTVDNWTLERIREHLDSSLPLVPLFNIAVLDVSEERGTVRLGSSEHVTRHGGIISGAVQFALADVAIYALIPAARRDPAVVTVDLTINFLRPANLPLLATAGPLRSGRRLFTAEVRITEETSARLVAQATGTYALSAGP